MVVGLAVNHYHYHNHHHYNHPHHHTITLATIITLTHIIITIILIITNVTPTSGEGVVRVGLGVDLSQTSIAVAGFVRLLARCVYALSGNTSNATHYILTPYTLLNISFLHLLTISYLIHILPSCLILYLLPYTYRSFLSYQGACGGLIYYPLARGQY